MKKILLSLIALVFIITTTTNGQIPNPGFENWTAGDPDGWTSSNVFPISLINITQTSDKHLGSYAVRGEVVDYLGTPMGPVIQSGPGATGFSISEQYHSIELYYKFTGIGGDKFSVNVALEKSGNPIAQGAIALPATIGTYTYLSVPLTYTTSDIPDWANIQISITGPVTGSDVHVGSVMFVDDLLFSLSTGIGNNPVPDLTGKCFPNPAADVINIPLNGDLAGEVSLSIMDVHGKEVKEITRHLVKSGSNVFQLSVEDLSPGLYVYSITGQHRQSSGKFTVTR